MLPYWILWLVFAGGALARHASVGLKRPSWALIAATLFLALLVGLRFEVGPDWEAYKYMFHWMRFEDASSAATHGDPAFYLLMWLVHYFGFKLWGLNLICALIFAFGLFRFSVKQPNPWLAILVAVPYLVIVIGMSATRQATAIGFVLIGLSYLGDRSPVRVLFWILIGSLFHASAVILAALVGASYTKNRVQAAVLLIAAAIPAYYALFATFGEYVQRYTKQDVDSGGVGYRVAMNAIPAIVLLASRSRMFITEEQWSLWRNLAILSLLLIPALVYVESTTAIDRLSLYAVPLQILVLSRFPVSISRSPTETMVPTVAVIAYSALTLIVYLLFASHAESYLPYKFVRVW